MQIEQLTQGIQAKFDQKRLVFWYDPELSFQIELSQLALDNVVIVDMGQESVLEIKKRIELDQPEQRFLLYFPYIEPEPERDWMLDIRLYSEQFYADHSSILLAELGINRMALRSHIHQRQSFFARKQRLAHLKKWVTENEDEVSLDRKMIAVLVKADSAAITDILLSLLKQFGQSLDDTTDIEMPLINQLIKYNLDSSFWSLLAEHYRYENPTPTFADFVLKLFCTDLWSQIDADDRDWLLNNVLKTASGRATALAFMASWRDSRNFSECYGHISKGLENQLEVGRKCSHYPPSQLMACETFEAIEQIIIRGLVQDLLDNGHKHDRVAFEGIVSHRLGCHWSHPTSLNGNEYTALYQSIHHAEILFNLQEKYVDGFHYDNAIAMYKAYETQLYQFDQSYRLFNEYVHAVQLISIAAAK